MDAPSILDLTGFVVLPGVVSGQQCRAILARLADRCEGAGTRNLLEQDWCAELAASLRDTLDLGAALSDSVAVQCTYFEKPGQANWLAPLQQDLSIPVRERVASPELEGWSMKEDAVFVQPPAEVVARMTVVRLHLDDVTEDGGPLRVVPGSHRLGRLRPEEMRAYRDTHGEVVCTTARGGVVAMKPLLLHSSTRSSVPRPRRVLHYLYGPRELPHGLAWAGAV
ncbi:MAG: phytanoyl-CoA dioxygenase family protein [Pseudomonadota bacterium]|jgi:hypothetical protein|nr:MAG: phytanoyl-CoA dioxygenase [Pseudomonadota bacterium]